jgi:hypothetical protein
MASSFQQRALQRKVIYGALILVLLTAAWSWRHVEFRAFGMDIKGVDAQARDLAVREQSRGEVDLVGAIVRLSTIGSRGAATCVLWVNAMDAQKKNQWNELELLVRSLTKLQPHFITPWIFQSWNLSYNVSVESDRINDKYFYITRGVALLAEGERQNRDNPDIRWSIGFFTQHKIGQSDETNTLRSLSQLSMIPPNERDPGRFQAKGEGRQELNLKEFEDFCKKHPQLVRRLREGIRRETRIEQVRQFRCERAEEVVQFLADNFRVPSLWEDVLPSQPGAWLERPDKLRPLADRFPVLPPPHTAQPHQQVFDPNALTTDSQLRDEDDMYQVARAWYGYAQEPIPPPDELPGHSKPIEDRVHQRIPRHMTTLIFRDYPAQAQRFTAERLQDEGWFDESGWDIPDWFRDQGDKFTDGEPAMIGGGRKWGQEAWQKTYEMWRTLGEANHLLFSGPAEQENMEKRAKAFGEKFNLVEGGQPPALREENLDAETRAEYFAWQFMKWYSFYRHVCNFPHHYNRSFVESKPETIAARKLFFEAEALRLRNSMQRALQKYEDPSAMKAWRDKVLLPNKEFRRDTFIQEQTFEVQLKYIDLYRELSGRAFKEQAARMVIMPLQNPAGAGLCPVGLTAWIPPLIRKNWDNPLLGGPFDVLDNEGQPLVDLFSRAQVMRRLYPGSVKAEAASETGEQQPAPRPAP